MKHDSPLRYPGGKASLAGLLAQTIKLNGLEGCPYYEPFAGGAGAALRLLREDVVSEVHLNDLDPAIAAFWRAVLDQPERFAEAIMEVPLNIEEWKRHRNIYQGGIEAASDLFDYGFATFYLNRCNRSGVLSGAGPIGGYEQAGEWKMDARFNRENLAERVSRVAERREQIHITQKDALRFLVEGLPRGNKRSQVFVYLDPPYFSNGNRLYLNYYVRRNHVSLAKYINKQKTLNWLISYDDTEFIKQLYSDLNLNNLGITYSLQNKRNANEVLIVSPCTSISQNIITASTCRNILIAA